MKYTITNTISYEVDEKVVYDFLEKENMTIEDYKIEISIGFKEMIESGIGKSEELRNLAIETNIKID